MNSNTLNRYLWLLNQLMQYHQLSFQQIADLWDKSGLNDNGERLNKRTVHNHRNAIEAIFNISIACNPHNGNKYYIETPLDEDGAQKWLLNSFQINDLLLERQTLKDRILLEDIPSGAEYLQTVTNAMKGNFVVAVSYRSFDMSDSKDFHFLHYCIKACRQRWYVLGCIEEDRSPEDDGIRCICLDRVQSMSLTEDTFQYPTDFSPSDFFKYSIGIWQNEKKLHPERIVLRVYGKMVKYLRAVPFHET